MLRLIGTCGIDTLYHFIVLIYFYAWEKHLREERLEMVAVLLQDWCSGTHRCMLLLTGLVWDLSSLQINPSLEAKVRNIVPGDRKLQRPIYIQQACVTLHVIRIHDTIGD